MTKKVVDEIILTCDVCGERLNARAQFIQSQRNGTSRLQSRPELFCPECDKPFNMIRRFKKQYAKKKEK